MAVQVSLLVLTVVKNQKKTPSKRKIKDSLPAPSKTSVFFHLFVCLLFRCLFNLNLALNLVKQHTFNDGILSFATKDVENQMGGNQTNRKSFKDEEKSSLQNLSNYFSSENQFSPQLLSSIQLNSF